MNTLPEEEEIFHLIRPAAPSPELMARLRAAAPRKGRVVTFHRRLWVGGTSLAAAAAVVIAFAVANPATPTAPRAKHGTVEVVSSTPVLPKGVVLPVAARSTLLEAVPAGVVHAPNQPPVRLLRAVWLDDVTAASSDPSEQVQWLQRREQFIPVSSTVY